MDRQSTAVGKEQRAKSKEQSDDEYMFGYCEDQAGPEGPPEELENYIISDSD